MAKYAPELKLKALGLINSGEPLHDISEQLDVTYPTLLKWKRDLAIGIKEKNLTSLIDIDETVVHEVADKIAAELIALDPSQSESIEGELLSVTTGIDGYQALSCELQRVAGKLAKKISAFSDNVTEVQELESLVTSLSKLQEAFFNKNQTNIAVFGGGQTSSTDVSKFRGLQKA